MALLDVGYILKRLNELKDKLFTPCLGRLNQFWLKIFGVVLNAFNLNPARASRVQFSVKTCVTTDLVCSIEYQNLILHEISTKSFVLRSSINTYLI